MLPETREGYLERYAALDFALIPLLGKKPIWDDWPHQFCTSGDQMKQVFLQQFPNANIGMVLEPSHLVSLDIDQKSDGNETLQKLEYEHGFQDTLRSMTGGGGQRLFYRAPKFAVPTKHKFAQGIELLAAGAQTVLPPSIHPDTHVLYLWDMMEDELDREHIRELPDWIIQRLREAETPARSETPLPAEKIVHPHRHNAMVSMAGVLRHRCAASEAELDAYLQIFNQTRCSPPHEPQHVSQIAKSVAQYAPSDPRIVSGLAKAYGQLRKERQAEQQFTETFQTVTGEDILKGDYKPLQPVVESMLYEGLTILYGPPKIGKSWLTMQLALAVASGAPLFGEQKILRPGKVLYMSLEETKSQTFSKLSMLQQDEPDTTIPRNIFLSYTMGKLLEDGLETLARGIEKYKPSLLVIDSFKKISSQSNVRDIVEREYAHTTKLSELGKESQTAIVLIHHGAKRNQAETLMDGAAGTHGITAGADCVARLARASETSYTLHGEGREIEEYQFALEKKIREGIGWALLAKGEDATWTQERDDIFQLLKLSAGKSGMSPKTIARELDKKGDAIRRLLRKMVNAGQLYQTADKNYVPLGDSLTSNVVSITKKPRQTEEA